MLTRVILLGIAGATASLTGAFIASRKISSTNLFSAGIAGLTAMILAINKII